MIMMMMWKMMMVMMMGIRLVLCIHLLNGIDVLECSFPK